MNATGRLDVPSIGRALPRFEDAELLQGRGRFTDDLAIAGQAHAAFVRSPHAHARIAAIDVSAAAAAAGVVAVFTGGDLLAEGLGSLPFLEVHRRHDGSRIVAPPRRGLTVDVARFVGDPVAMVIAETRNQALDAAEMVDVSWEPLPAVADVASSASAVAPAVWGPAFTTEHGNLAAYYRNGNPDAVASALATARHVIRLTLVNQRVVANPLEPRALAAEYDPADGRFTLHCPTQNVFYCRTQLASVFGLGESNFRVLSRNVGGGFGTRGYIYPEHAALCFAARRLRRAVKWLASRSENFLAEVHGRDNLTEAELAIGDDARFSALRIRTLANVGAYLSNVGAVVPALSGARAPTGVYAVPLLDHEVRMLFTNTAPVDAYRGAGRPEIGYVLERLVSRAVAELGADPVELRLKNMVGKSQMPYSNPAGFTYDCGDFANVLRRALEVSDADGFKSRKSAAIRRGVLYGRGFACYVEVTGSVRPFESVRIAATSCGDIVIRSGTQPIGQGIATAYAQIAADRLGIPPERVRIEQGDSDLLEAGGGSGGSRGLQVGGSAVHGAAAALIDAALVLAAGALEASAADIEFVAGRFRVAGTDRSVSLYDLAARQPDKRVECHHLETVDGQTWPNGCQICEAEVDPETGVVTIVRLTAIDDIGNVINPLIAEGQVHGGIAQGLGQALIEQSIYDEHGQLLTGSFMDYGMPRADLMPHAMATAFDASVPTRLNPLGAKGVGEAGCHGAMPAVVNAVLDALSERGVTGLDMPLTPERVWRALKQSSPREERRSQ